MELLIENEVDGWDGWWMDGMDGECMDGWVGEWMWMDE